MVVRVRIVVIFVAASARPACGFKSWIVMTWQTTLRYENYF